MKVDMSGKAVTVRLKLVSQLRRLCLSLAKAKPMSSTPTTPQKPEENASSRTSTARVLE